MAHNLAFSLRHHSPNIKIGLYISEELLEHLPDKSLFNEIRILKEDQYRNYKGLIDPAVAKTQIYRLGTEISDRFLYLDVDAICINDIEPLLSRLKGLTIATEVIDQGTKDKSISYSLWATNETIWEHFQLPEDATLCGIQSSWAYFEKSHAGDIMQQWLDYFMAVGFPHYKLSQSWGGTLPDELIYQGVYAKMGIVPSLPESKMKPIFFGHKSNDTTEEDALTNYHLLSLFGNGKGRTLVLPKYMKLHDRLLKQYGDMYGFKAKDVMNDKHLNK